MRRARPLGKHHSGLFQPPESMVSIKQNDLGQFFCVREPPFAGQEDVSDNDNTPFPSILIDGILFNDDMTENDEDDSDVRNLVLVLLLFCILVRAGFVFPLFYLESINWNS